MVLNMPKLSVILPTYSPDVEYFKRCVDSVLHSSFPDFELIIIDDGSENRIRIEIEKIAALDTRIVLVHQQNKGVSSARNNGISIARGDYLAFVDDDDYISPFFLEQSLKIAKDADCDLVMGVVTRESFGGKTQIFFNETVENTKILVGEEAKEYAYEMLESKRKISILLCMYKISVYFNWRKYIWEKT